MSHPDTGQRGSMETASFRFRVRLPSSLAWRQQTSSHHKRKDSPKMRRSTNTHPWCAPREMNLWTIHSFTCIDDPLQCLATAMDSVSVVLAHVLEFCGLAARSSPQSFSAKGRAHSGDYGGSPPRSYDSAGARDGVAEPRAIDGAYTRDSDHIYVHGSA